ncbi:RNA polymerase sigma factor [Thermostaphylospora chromogena]|uniref:RNA polymerase sigma-70 factor, ECF subfamily n=1 Tax=Thermostaphylospora chromogena TaxID=35622 RepID=A0A1H1C0C0_9ACTN|nr:RNA polymerase sigma factor [Thermostaphylospora chromogena]SDQ57086.1 RNA polymerase sigma-70 factor, ECF subfamily [Thermostaphylospora chromogena]
MSLRARIRDGDEAAFEALFDEMARPVYSHALWLTGSWSTAEDVVSLTFLEAWRLRHRIDADGGSLRPWVLGIATNVARNVRRASRRYENALARMPRGEAAPDFTEEVVDRVEAAERLDAIRKVFGSLRRTEREVFALCVWAGLDHAEAAQALGVAPGTVRSRLSRARKRLEKLVAERQRSAGRRQVMGDRGTAVQPVREEC